MALTKNAQTYETRARELLEEGFRTKSAQLDAISYTNTAFDYIKDAVRKAQIAAAPVSEQGVWSEERSAFFAARDIPFQLIHIRDKHLPLFDEFTPGLRADLERLLELRAQIKAAPVAPKAAPKGPAVAAPDELRMTCQICGRAIHANTGKIAHHGYQRPGHGYQTASCPGAQHVPFELSRDILERYIEQLHRRHDSLEGTLRQIAAGELSSTSLLLTDYDAPHHHGRTRPSKIVTFTRDNIEQLREELPKTLSTNRVRSFEDAQESLKVRSEAEVQQLRIEITHQADRYMRWEQTHSWDGKAYVPA